MKRLLVTGFDPFDGAAVNPSWEAVSRLPDSIGEWMLAKLEVPTVYGIAGEAVLATAMALCPDAIICVGQAGGRPDVTPEVVGINLRESEKADNYGRIAKNESVIDGGDAAYFATLPVRAMVEAIKEAGLPASLSYSAGAFVCNDLLYTLLHHYDGSDVQVGFIHVPHLPEQAADGAPSMCLDDMIRALTTAILVL